MFIISYIGKEPVPMFQRKNREVLITNDPAWYGRSLQALIQKNIPYKTKTINTGSQNRRTGTMMGRFGENISLQILYYIYVSEVDYENAVYLIQKCKNI